MSPLLAQALMNRLVAVRDDGFRGRMALRVLNLIRRAVSHVWDPLVTYDLDGRRIFLPLSHNLPVSRKLAPDYSANLGRIAAAVAAARPGANAVDIGANIGDSVAIMRSRSFLPVLCIEANSSFLHILEKNLPALGPQVYVYAGFVATRTETVIGNFQVDKGSAYMTQTATGAPIAAKALEDILQGFPEFQNPALLKIDTDGFDVPILIGALSFLGRPGPKPVLFFEYDPHFIAINGSDALAAIEELSRIGYAKALVYDNLGDLMVSGDLTNKTLWEDLNAYFSGRGGHRYMDVCIFSKEDISIFESLRTSEHAHFRQHRGGN